jgi:hypothetical protein
MHMRSVQACKHHQMHFCHHIRQTKSSGYHKVQQYDSREIKVWYRRSSASPNSWSLKREAILQNLKTFKRKQVIRRLT